MSLKKDILVRVSVVYLGMVVFGLLILGKALYLQFVEKDKWEGEVYNTIRHRTIEPNRGNIYSIDGRLLAVSVPYYEVRMDMRSESFTDAIFNRGVDSLSMALAELFRDRHWTTYRKQLKQARREGERYYLVKRNVSYMQLQKVKEFPVFRLGRYRGGFIIEQQNKRVRPHGLLAARTIGYTMQGDRGSVVGIEGAYDQELRGVEGYRLMRRINSDIWMPISDRNEVEPRDGYDVVTTIDIDLQDVAENALLAQLRRHEADHGTVVVMEVSSGRIRAIANLGLTEEGTYREFYNYAVGESAEPGSTFKLASMIALLEDGHVEPGDQVDVGDGVTSYYGQKLKDSGDEGLGVITVREALEYSSNVGISKLVYEHYNNKPEAFVDRLYELGLNRKLGIEVKGEGEPDIKYTDSPLWSGLSLPMMSIGYEVRMTPLQILALYNAVANDGEMVKPRFAEELRYHGTVVKQFDKEVLNHRLCSRETLEKVDKMLRGVVDHGTAKNLRNSYYDIAGKTGTSQIANEKFGYNKTSYQASFVGYFPAENPRYSCIVVVNSPSKSVYYGNLVAGPIFREIADNIYVREFGMQGEESVEVAELPEAPYSKSGYRSSLEKALGSLGIESEPAGGDETDWVVTRSTDDAVELHPRTISSLFVPDVSDMGAADAVHLLENLGMQVKVNGRGTVRGQSLPPGHVIREGEVIELKMSISEG